MSKYWPLFCLILIAALASLAIAPHNWMQYFMGFFLCQFAMLKLFHPTQFADGFQMYDLFAQKSRHYALAYPALELALGLAYLASFQLTTIYILTIILFGASLFSVLRALRQGLDVRCSCMGTVLDVPLSTVTLTENLTMIVMALYMLL